MIRAFKSNQAIIFNVVTQLMMTKSRYYLKTILNNVTIGKNTNVTLLTENSKSKIHIALKLYQQFAHPLPDKIKLIQLGTHGIHIRNLRNQYEKSAKNVTSTRTCKIYQKE